MTGTWTLPPDPWLEGPAVHADDLPEVRVLVEAGAAVAPLACQLVVAEAAYDDRGEQAHRVLVRAVEEAVAFIRSGDVGRAEYRLTRGEMSANRILGGGR